MDITTMGERIKELRRNAGMTQEELGNKIGVTAQAVSKWECGSVPDTELIPKIADCFGVAIDVLFGREYENYDPYNIMSKHLIGGRDEDIENEEIVRRGFKNCYVSIIDAMYRKKDGFEKHYTTEEKIDRMLSDYFPYVKIFTDELIALMDATADSPSFFYMPEAEGRAKKLLESTDYVSLFAALSDPDVFNAIIYLQSHKLSRYTKSVFITKVGIPAERADEVLETLRKYEFIHIQPLELDDAVIETYQSTWVSYFIMFLQSAHYLLNRFQCCSCSSRRSEPPLKLDD